MQFSIKDYFCKLQQKFKPIPTEKLTSMNVSTAVALDMRKRGFILLEIFSYMEGVDILFRISRLSKRWRKSVQWSYLLD